MKKLMLLLLVLLSLAGCSAPVDGRLAEADSLLCAGMQEKAFTILKSVSPGSLRGRGNRAYYALLYTQAQYKCYEPIRNDSLINIAVDYYDGSDDYDKPSSIKGRHCRIWATSSKQSTVTRKPRKPPTPPTTTTSATST